MGAGLSFITYSARALRAIDKRYYSSAASYITLAAQNADTKDRKESIIVLTNMLFTQLLNDAKTAAKSGNTDTARKILDVAALYTDDKTRGARFVKFCQENGL